MQLVGELPGAVGAAMAQAVYPGLKVVALLQRDPQAELQALLEVLEPVSTEKAQVPVSGKADPVGG